MSSNWPKPGPNHVPSYQTSGIPFVTSSTLTEVRGPDNNSASSVSSVSFPYVTRAVTIRNIGANPLRVGFSERGIFDPGVDRLSSTFGGVQKPDTESKNYFIIPSSGSINLSGNASLQHCFSFDVRCTKIFFVSHVAPQGTPSDADATGFSVLAELTTISAESFPTLTGSLNGTGSFEGIG